MNWPLLTNSLLVGGLSALLATVFGLVAALCLAGLAERARRALLVAAIMTAALPPFLVTNCWLHFLGLAGVWRGWLPFNLLTPGGTIWVLSLLLWPIPLAAVWGAWQRLEPSQLECDPAVTGWTLIRGLLLPLARTTLAQAAVLAFVLALNNFAVPAILQVKVFPAEMWVRFNTTFDTAGALRLSWPLVLGPLLLILWLVRSEIPWPRIEGTASPRLFRRQLGAAWFGACSSFTFLLCLVSLGLPVLQLVSMKRTWTELPGALAAGRTAVWSSFWFAAAAATIVVTLGLTAAQTRCGTPRGTGAGQKAATVFGWLLWLPFLTPGVLMGIGLIAVFNHPWTRLFYQGAGIVVLAFVLRYLALGWHAAAHAFRGVDRELTDAARLEGAQRWQMFWCVYWPQTSSRLAAAWYLVFLLCLWDVESMILVTPPGGETTALRVFNLLHYGHNAQVNALCLTLLGLAAAPLLLWVGWNWVRRSLAGGAAAGPADRKPDGNGMRSSSRRDAATIAQSRRCGIGYDRLGAMSPKGTADAGVLGRPFGTRLSMAVSPTLKRWAILECSFGTGPRGTAQAILGRALGVGCLLTLLAGCSPSPESNEAPLQSGLFSRVRIIGSRGVGVGQFNKPRSVALDAQDNLYVVDMTGRVQKFTSNGEFVVSWQMPQTDLGKPKGMGRDRDGNIIVIEPHYQRINHFSPSGQLLAQWGVRGTNEGHLMMPRAIAINSHDEAFVSEYSLVERVQRFNLVPIEPALSGAAPLTTVSQAGVPEVRQAAGLPLVGASSHAPPNLAGLAQPREGSGAPPSLQPEFLNSFGHAGTTPGEMNRPEGLCLDAQERLYVADSCNHRIQVFSREGKFLRAYGKPGQGLGELSYPYDIRVDAAGRQYVCEFGNSRIQVFDAADHPIEIIGGPGVGPGQFNDPWSIAFDSAGNLYVADSQNHRVQKLIRSPRLASAGEAVK
jgi:ABC-type Fe3+ transport system permease subunit/sugar lactone lactonase YvrE